MWTHKQVKYVVQKCSSMQKFHEKKVYLLLSDSTIFLSSLKVMPGGSIVPLNVESLDCRYCRGTPCHSRPLYESWLQVFWIAVFSFWKCQSCILLCFVTILKIWKNNLILISLHNSKRDYWYCIGGKPCSCTPAYFLL